MGPMKLESGRSKSPTERLEQSISRSLEQLPEPLQLTWQNRFKDATDNELEALDIELRDHLEKREAALMSIEMPDNLDQSLVEEIKEFDRNVALSFRNGALFQGNGATAEVYEVLGHPQMCVKFITNQERYNENNNLRVEFSLLGATTNIRAGRVRTPVPYFLRMHPKEGHSFGMEKVEGKSLSQILENPSDCPELVTVAKSLARDEVREELKRFIIALHDRGITHNDLYKRNIMLDRSGNLFVIDFGKAKRDETEAQRHMNRERDLTSIESEIRSFFAGIDNI